MEPLYNNTPKSEDIYLSQDTGPSYVYMKKYKIIPGNEDTSFNQNSLSCPKGVWNRGVNHVHLCSWLKLFLVFNSINGECFCLLFLCYFLGLYSVLTQGKEMLSLWGVILCELCVIQLLRN